MSAQQSSLGTVRSGVLWMLLARFSETGLGFVNTAILARLLSPADFGLVALATSVMAGVELLSAFGFDWALVRQRDLRREHLDTAWTLRSALGLLSCIILVALSPTFAAFYAEPRMSVMLPILGLAMLVSGIENPGVVAFRRDFNFSREFILRTAPKLCGMLLAIPVAIVTRSWWALLIGIVAGRVVSTIASYVMHPHRPRMTLVATRDLLSFSAWLFLNNLLDFMRWRLSTFIVGKILGNRSVGLFTVSMDLSNLGTTELAAPINRAVFSKYALDSNNPDALARGFLAAAPAIWMIALPVAAGIALAAPQFIVALLGQDWSDGGPILRLMAVAGALHVMSANTAYVYWALGRSRIVAGITLWGVCVLVPGTIIGAMNWGLQGVAYAYIAATLAMLPLNYGVLMKLIKVSYLEFFGRVWRTGAACGAMIVVVSMMSAQWQPTDSLMAIEQLVRIALVGAIVYTGTHWLLWIATGRGNGPEELVVDTLKSFGTRLMPNRTLRS